MPLLAVMSDLDLIESPSEDPITASLLQARLIELGHNTSVEIVDGT
jgi:hypothetical protein